MEEQKENKFFEFIRNNSFVVAIVLGLLAFVGFAFPMVSAKVADYDAVNGAFVKIAGRTNYGIEQVFGINTRPCIPLLIAFGVLLVAIVLTLLTFYNHQFQSYGMVFFFVSGILLILANYLYSYTQAVSFKEVVGDPVGYYYQDLVNIMEPRLEAGSIIMAALCFAAGIVCFAGAFSKEKASVKELTETGMLIAAAVVIDVIFHFLPNIPGQAGSISFAMFPLVIIALRRGPIKAFLAASFVFGLITCLTDGYGLWLYPLDYFIAYSGVAAFGIFRKQILNPNVKTYNVKGIAFIVISMLIMGFVRLVGSGLSSVLNYDYTIQAAFVANIIYVGISALITGGFLIAVYKPVITLNNRFPVEEQLEE